MLYKSLFALILTNSLFANKLVPIPITKQISEADGVILGEFNGKIYKKDREGKVLTEASFRILKSAGVNSRYLVNRNQFSIHYDGGVWQSLVYENENAPEFVEGSQYVILLERDNFGYKPYFDKLGVYDFYGKNDETIISSVAFPAHPGLGEVSFKTFDIWVRTSFGSYLSDIPTDKHISEKEHQDQHKRSIASEDDQEGVEVPSVNIFWLAVIFGLIGAARIRRVKSRK